MMSRPSEGQIRERDLVKWWGDSSGGNNHHKVEETTLTLEEKTSDLILSATYYVS